MRVELLGSGGFHPNDRRHTLCVLLPELGLMLDAGTGAFRAHGRVTTPRLDIVLTHAHLDHIAGLTTLIGLEHDGTPVDITLHAQAPVCDAVRESLFSKPLFPIPTVDRYEQLDEGLHGAGQFSLDEAVLTTFPLEHPGGSLGVRLDCRGKSMALVTDTLEPNANTVEAVRGVDLLLHEAYFGDAEAGLAKMTGHCTASQAARVAAESGAKRLVMVHRDPRAADDRQPLAEARALFRAAEYGQDNQVIEF